MELPQGLKFSKEHEWVKVDGNVATIGITEYAQDQLGDIVYVDISVGEGDDIEEGEVFGSIEAVKTVSDLFMPITGKLIEINEGLDDAPENVNSDPYGEGWIIKVEIADASQLDNLLDADGYKSVIE